VRQGTEEAEESCFWRFFMAGELRSANASASTRLLRFDSIILQHMFRNDTMLALRSSAVLKPIFRQIWPDRQMLLIATFLRAAASRGCCRLNCSAVA
jgi:hypothetical protein